ncbi:MAG: DUF58 domain-containing protein [Vulcanimicrobiaceae bacterium]
MERPPRLELTAAPPAGIAVLGASLAAAVIAGATHPGLRVLVVFVAAFPLLWIGIATALSYTTARALRTASVELPSRPRALGSFRLAHTLAHVGRGFPAIGVLTNAGFSSGDAAVDSGPWAEIPFLEGGHVATSHWDVMPKRRGPLWVGPFRAAVELPGSALRVTAVFERRYEVAVLPAVYHLQPFVDALLAGRHGAAGRFQKIPVASEEYVGAREYRIGDSPKLIHRVLSLRMPDPDEFYVREFQDPSRDDLAVLLDTAPPLDGDDALHRYRLEKAVCFASALCRAFAARRLRVHFVCQRGPHDIASLRLRPRDADLDRLDRELALLDLKGDRATRARIVLGEVRRHGGAVIFVSLRPREAVEQQRLPMVTLGPDHVPVFTREVVSQ